MKSVVEVYSDMAKQNPPWKPDEESLFIKSCVTRSGKWKSKAMKDRFVNEALKHNLSLVFSIMNKVAFKKNDEDVLQRAVVALAEALKKYDPSKEIKISTWITNPIRWSILQSQRAYSHVGGVADDISGFNHRHGTNLSVVSVDSEVSHDSDGSETFGNFICPEDVHPDYISLCGLDRENEHESNDTRSAVAELVAEAPKFLNKKETVVLKGLVSGLNMSEISVEMKLSRMRISQLSASVFDKIRRSRFAKSLRELVGGK